MNNSFSFTRLWRLILKQGMENARFYLLYGMASLGIAGLLIGFWLTIKSRNEYYEEHFYSYMLLALFLCGTLFANLQFESLSKKARGIAWLSFPASHLEKLLCALFYTVIVFNGLFLAGMMAIKWLLIYCITHGIPEGSSWLPSPPFMESDQLIFVYMFIAVQSFYLLGSVYFARFSFVKTTVSLAILVALGAYYLYFLDSRLLNESFNWRADGSIYIVASTKIGGMFFHKMYQPTPWLIDTVVWLMKYGWAPAFWIISWKRLAEKEI